MIVSVVPFVKKVLLSEMLLLTPFPCVVGLHGSCGALSGECACVCVCVGGYQPLSLSKMVPVAL